MKAIRERNANNVIDRWIAERVAGLSFCDIGGIGLRSINERVSTAVRNRAARAAMIDLRREDFQMWRVFHKTMHGKGIEGYECLYGINLESKTLPEEMGVFDFVHCTGILYHTPSPVLAMWNLSRVTGRLLIVNTVTLPSVIENEQGRLEVPSSGAIFLPSLCGQAREILKAHYISNLGWTPDKVDRMIPPLVDETALMPYIQKSVPRGGAYWEARGDLSYTPYWWVFHEDAFRALVEMYGFRTLATHNRKGHALNLLCEKTG